MTQLTRTYFQWSSYGWDSSEMDNVTLPRLNINPNFASPQLLLLACILRCLYSVTPRKEFPLCLCGRHCIGMTPRETLLTPAGKYATDCTMPGKKRQTKWGTALWQWRTSLLPNRRVGVKTTSLFPQKSLTGVVDLKLPPLFPSHSQLSAILPVTDPNISPFRSPFWAWFQWWSTVWQWQSGRPLNNLLWINIVRLTLGAGNWKLGSACRISQI